MHNDAYIGGRSENNIKCVLHDDLRWKNRTTRYNNNNDNAGFLPHQSSFTSGFLGFIVVEHIRFFHGALQLAYSIIPQYHMHKSTQTSPETLGDIDISVPFAPILGTSGIVAALMR